MGGDQHTDRRQILGRMHPASRGLRWEPESSWGRAFLRRRVRRQTRWAGKRPLTPVSGGAKFPGASGTSSAPGRPSSHRFGRRMRRKPPETAENARGGAPRRGGRPTYRQTPNFRADASRKSGLSLGAGVELGESVSAPAGPASNAMGGEKAVNAGFGRRKISWSLGDIVRARTTVVAPIRSADAAETPGNSRKCKRGSAASWGATNIPTDAKFWGGCIPQVGVFVGSRSRAGGERFCAGWSGVKRDGRGKGR